MLSRWYIVVSYNLRINIFQIDKKNLFNKNKLIHHSLSKNYYIHITNKTFKLNNNYVMNWSIDITSASHTQHVKDKPRKVINMTCQKTSDSIRIRLKHPIHIKSHVWALGKRDPRHLTAPGDEGHRLVDYNIFRYWINTSPIWSWALNKDTYGLPVIRVPTTKGRHTKGYLGFIDGLALAIVLRAGSIELTIERFRNGSSLRNMWEVVVFWMEGSL